MLLIQAAKLATAQRRIVRKVAQYNKGDVFNIDDKIKSLNITINDAVPNKDTYKCVPKRLSDFAKKIADATGEFSKNPIKKITSWVKCYVQNVKDLFKAKRAQIVADATSASKPNAAEEIISETTPEVEEVISGKIKFDKKDVPEGVITKAEKSKVKKAFADTAPEAAAKAEEVK